ncbi:unnamed protein product [Effrenium voratum]|uniref:EF-hand domain-containing protein n=1 Tax=Effrenium voratum TaxID=2562239 RepID=A0AA36NBY7_9DINO|nr:unnamed protein product [Effrenium voratum]CAJ1401572.1 unnamed protein product [Effrenium voratum]CAJ1447470.1 unnamed protein product [Effrenium voratum]|mmetsp:Transcript_129075/g.306191  ORF Transcript_129075/g.306191 Transcript_129075/m.306191 type:complete len:329 (-) Transcript_129075:7-993(-)
MMGLGWNEKNNISPLLGKPPPRTPFFVTHPRLTNLLFLLAYMGVGLMVFSLVEGCQPETALYMVAQIVTTIGYGDAVKVTHHTQTFMALYVLFGTLLFVNLATDLFHTLLERTQIGIDHTLALVQAGLSGKESEVNESHIERYPLLVASSTFLAILALWVAFFAYYESCTCSYESDFVPGCIEGPDCAKTGGYQTDIHGAFYMAVITFSTVGFGDVAPKSKLGRTVGSVGMMVGVAAFGTLVGELFRRLKAIKFRYRKLQLCTPQMFEMMDSEQNGKVSRSEFLRYMLIRQGKVSLEAIQQIDTLFDTLDKDHNGKLSFEEIEGHMLD